MKKIFSMRAFVLSLILVLFQGGALLAKEKLILMGGGEYTPEGIAQFAAWAGGDKANILILPWATSSQAEEFESMKELFAPYHPNTIEWGGAFDAAKFDKAKLMAQIESATGIFFPGGDQVDLMARINHFSEVRENLLKRYHQGVVFGGYSAGTAIASKTMLTGNGDDKVINSGSIEVAEGLGLVENFVVDQHFIARKRQNRLLSVLQTSEESIGVGIDEGMALVLEDGKRGVILGDSLVTVFYRKQSPFRFELTLLKKGDKITLP